MRRVCGNMYRFAGSHSALLPAKGRFHLAFEQNKGLFKVVTMQRRSAAGWDVHVDQAETARSCLPWDSNRIGIANQADVRQILISIRPSQRKSAVKIIGR